MNDINHWLPSCMIEKKAAADCWDRKRYSKCKYERPLECKGSDSICKIKSQLNCFSFVLCVNGSISLIFSIFLIMVVEGWKCFSKVYLASNSDGDYPQSCFLHSILIYTLYDINL